MEVEQLKDAISAGRITVDRLAARMSRAFAFSPLAMGIGEAGDGCGGARNSDSGGRPGKHQHPAYSHLEHGFHLNGLPD
jgi:hypothetical protein